MENQEKKLTNAGKPHVCGDVQPFAGDPGTVNICTKCRGAVDKPAFDWELFAKAHRPKTVEFCKEYAAKIISKNLTPNQAAFAAELSTVGKPRMSPSKAAGIYQMLALNGALGVILNDNGAGIGCSEVNQDAAQG